MHNAERNLKNFSFIDSNSLLRASFEYFMMAVGIEEDEAVFDDFIKMYKIGKEKISKDLAPAAIRKGFGKFLYMYDCNAAGEIMEDDCIGQVNNFYSLLCRYTHPSMIATIMPLIRSHDGKIFMKECVAFTTYHIKWFLHFTICHFADMDTAIRDEILSTTYYVQILKTSYLRKDSINYDKIQKAMYLNSANLSYHEEVLEEIKGYRQRAEEEGWAQDVPKYSPAILEWYLAQAPPCR